MNYTIGGLLGPFKGQQQSESAAEPKFQIRRNPNSRRWHVADPRYILTMLCDQILNPNCITADRPVPIGCKVCAKAIMVLEGKS